MYKLPNILLTNGLLGFSRGVTRRSLTTRYAIKKPRPSVAKLTILGTTASLFLYDGVVNEFVYTGASWRFLRSLKTAALISVDYLLLQQNESDKDYDTKLKAVHQKSANLLLETCLLNGGLYIKVGQGFAAINHILPEEYTKTLAQLQDKCLFTSKEDVQKVFRRDFGALPEEIFAEFNYTPVAAASLAQVFKAKLKSGEQAAVKVQYSDLQRRFSSDLATIIFLHDIIELIFKDYNFGWILRDVHKNLVQELDFKNEAKNSERCAQDLAKLKYVHIPKVHWQHTDKVIECLVTQADKIEKQKFSNQELEESCSTITLSFRATPNQKSEKLSILLFSKSKNIRQKRVLTMEWIDGIKMSDMEGFKRLKLDVRDIDLKLFKMFAEQIFNTGFVHADPHASNVFVRRDPKTKSAELVLLDHGLYEELPASVRLPLCEFWEATVLSDEKKMAAAAQRLNIKDHIKFAEVLFQQPIRQHGGRVRTRLTDSDIAYMQKIAKNNFDQIMSTLKEMPRNMLFVVRNLNTVRAIGHLHHDVVDRPRVMARHAQRCLYANQNSLVSYMRWLYRRAHFEYSLWRTSFKQSCLQLYFRILYYLGRAPESALTILDQLKNPDYLS